MESSAKESIEQAAEGKKAVEAANIAVAEAMQRGRVSLMQVCFLAVFCHAFLWGMAAPVAVLCAAWTWGPITSQGSVCSSSLFAEQNTHQRFSQQRIHTRAELFELFGELFELFGKLFELFGELLELFGELFKLFETNCKTLNDS